MCAFVTYHLPFHSFIEKCLYSCCFGLCIHLCLRVLCFAKLVSTLRCLLRSIQMNALLYFLWLRKKTKHSDSKVRKNYQTSDYMSAPTYVSHLKMWSHCGNMLSSSICGCSDIMTHHPPLYTHNGSQKPICHCQLPVKSHF
jgi:hypothetical protein